MSYLKRLFSFIFLFILTDLAVYAQQDSVSLNSILEKTVKFTNDRPVEKVYLHFDKPYYAVGDTIWFKAYVTMDLHQPSILSKVVNIDVINSKDSLMQSIKLPVTNSVAYGNFTLAPLSYKQGNYRIRAYTQWMMNSDVAYFFDKTITVGNAMDKEINTNISFSGNANDKSSKLNARILFTNPSGAPLANRKVDWRLYADYDIAAKGKEQTDRNGYVNINLGNKRTGLNTGSLITSIETGDKKSTDITFPLKSAFKGADVQFFPEGGDLIDEVPTQIAFKAIGSDGLGINVKGNIVDNAGATVASFSSQHLGMGKFILTPEENKTYKAVVNFEDGSSATYDLPKAKTTGITFSIDNRNAENLNLRIIANNSFFQLNKNKSFYIIAQCAGLVTYAARTHLEQQSYSASIPKDKFKTGIAQLTLFSMAGEPLSERIVFINHNDGLNITLKTDRPNYTTRQKVKVGVITKVQGQAAAGNLSVAVVDESKVPVNEDAETTILSNLLLTSDLKGYIEKPNYYFNHTDAKKADDLDVLMLTQGYRRFSYKDIISGKLPPLYFLPEEGIELSGILRLFNGMPVFKAAIRLTIPDKHFSAETITDADGNFKFSNLVFPDSSEVTITARNNVNSKNMRLTMNGQPYPSISPNMNTPDEIVNIDSTLNPYLQNSNKQYSFTRLLKEVVVKGTQPIKKPSHLDYSALTGLSMEPDHLIAGDRLTDCNIFTLCLQTAALGLTFADNNFYITRSYNSGSRVPVQIFVKGLPVDVNYLNTLNPAEVESVEIFLNDGLSGINRQFNTNGVLVVNMKTVPKGRKMSSDELKKLFPDQNAITFMPKGYDVSRQFYLPKYEGPKTSAQANDYRTTVFWNPQIITDASGNASFEFFNSDGKGTYKAVVEGIDKDGNIGRAVYRYIVK